MRKLIDFTEKQILMINEVKDREGHKTFTSALAAIISGYYVKTYYSKYKEMVTSGEATEEKPAAAELTPEQYCESLGGIVEKGSCVFKRPGFAMQGRAPLNETGRFKEMAKTIGTGPYHPN